MQPKDPTRQKQDGDHTERPERLRNKVYGRRVARPLRNERQKAVDEWLPLYALTPEDAKTKIKPENKNWLEIGFGNGEHLIWQAEKNSDVHLIGCEPFLNGVSYCVADLHKAGLKNISIWADDARAMINALPDASIERIFVLHPDPWHKKRHHKRRFIQQETLDEFARIMKPGGILRMSSDHPGVAEWMLGQALIHHNFEWFASNKTYASTYDWRTRPDDWPQTRYEAKGLKAGREPYYLEFTRIIPNPNAAKL